MKLKSGSFNKKNNKAHYDKPQSSQKTPIRMASRKGQFGRRTQGK